MRARRIAAARLRSDDSPGEGVAASESRSAARACVCAWRCVFSRQRGTREVRGAAASGARAGGARYRTTENAGPRARRRRHRVQRGCVGARQVLAAGGAPCRGELLACRDHDTGQSRCAAAVVTRAASRCSRRSRRSRRSRASRLRRGSSAPCTRSACSSGCGRTRLPARARTRTRARERQRPDRARAAASRRCRRRRCRASRRRTPCRARWRTAGSRRSGRSSEPPGRSCRFRVSRTPPPSSSPAKQVVAQRRQVTPHGRAAREATSTPRGRRVIARSTT